MVYQIYFLQPYVALRFEKCHGVHTLFLKEHEGNFLVVSLCADDIIIASSQSTDATELIVKLGLAFHLRDCGPPKFFLYSETEEVCIGFV